MLSLTTIAFIAIFIFFILASVFYHPMFGMVGYMFVYFTNPPSQWWGVGLAHMGIRLVLLMSIAIIIGFFLQRDKITFKPKFHRLEILFYFFLIIVWLSRFIGFPLMGHENFALKLTKVAVFLFFFVRIVIDLEKYEVFLWTIVIVSGLYLAFKTNGVSTASLGRVDIGFGGPDFREGNFLSAHFAATLPLIGVLFLKSSGKGKAVALIAGAMTMNALILCRSRGAFVALLVGVIAAVVMAPKNLRKKIYPWVLVAIIGSFLLVDPGFMARMYKINPDITNIEDRDESSAYRIMAWQAALDMAMDHPLGIGQGNFKYYVGDYNYLLDGRDTHNTYLRCLAELGVQGLIILLLIIASDIKTLREVEKKITGSVLENEFKLHVYGLTVSLIIFLTASFFITEIYVEEFYWFLFLPLILENSLAGALES